MKKGSALHWLILGALGIFLILGQQITKTIVYSILGLGLMVAGVFGAINWWRNDRRSLDGFARLLGSLVMFVFGLWILVHPGAFDRLINVAIGVVLIVGGLQWLIGGLNLPGRDMLLVVAGAIAIILGIVIACSNAATSWVIIAEGIGLIYTAIVGFFAERKLAK